MKKFQLVREEDETGISGTGVVAEGVQSTNGKCVLFWLSELKSVAVYDSISELKAIHGHNGKTQVVWEGTPVYEYKSVPNFCECESPEYSSWSCYVVITGVVNKDTPRETVYGAKCTNCHRTIDLKGLTVASFEEYEEKYSPTLDVDLYTNFPPRKFRQVCVKCGGDINPLGRTHYCKKENNEN